MVGQHSTKIGNLDSGRATLCVIGNAVSCHHVGPCLRWRSVQTCRRDFSHRNLVCRLLLEKKKRYCEPSSRRAPLPPAPTCDAPCPSFQHSPFTTLSSQ